MSLPQHHHFGRDSVQSTSKLLSSLVQNLGRSNEHLPSSNTRPSTGNRAWPKDKEPLYLDPPKGAQWKPIGSVGESS